MRYLTWLALLTAQTIAASPFMSLELKPLGLYSPNYEGGREYELGGEMHITAHIAVFGHYLRSRFTDPSLDSERPLDYTPAPLQEFDITETGLGLTLYSAPEASSLYLGMGVVSRRANYTLHHNAMPLSWQSEASKPLATIGYRWSPASHLIIRSGMKASWTRQQETYPDASSEGFYLRQDSFDFIENKIAEVEGPRELTTSFDLGIGVYF